jgi:hypothetical protein
LSDGFIGCATASASAAADASRSFAYTTGIHLPSFGDLSPQRPLNSGSERGAATRWRFLDMAGP